jgi:hypothetical protein
LSRQMSIVDFRPRDPTPDPRDIPFPDGVASKPDAAPGTHEQGKG